MTRENINGQQFVNFLRLLRASHPETTRFILYLDNAKYYHAAVVQEWLARHPEFDLEFLPAYSPNLNLIERLWRFTKRQAAYGRYHPTFAEFRAAVQEVLDRVPTTHAEKLASLMTLDFQEFDDVSFLAA